MKKIQMYGKLRLDKYCKNRKHNNKSTNITMKIITIKYSSCMLIKIKTTLITPWE